MRPNVAVTELLDKLEENRRRHQVVNKAAVEEWRRKALVDVSRLADQLASGHNPDVRLNLPKPADHTRDYDRAITMVQMHQGGTIELSEDDAAQFIQDDWAWTRQWRASNSGYAAGTMAEIYGEDVEF